MARKATPAKATAAPVETAKSGARASGSLPTGPLSFASVEVEIPKRVAPSGAGRPKMVNPFGDAVAGLAKTFEKTPNRGLSVPCDEANVKYWTGLIQRAAREHKLSAYVRYADGQLAFRLQKLVSRPRKTDAAN